MNNNDLLRFTLQSVLSHRLRSVLTALGIGIGVAAVVLLTSMGEGLNQFMIKQFSQFGTNVIAINPGRPATLGLTPGVLNTERPLSMNDAEALGRLPYVDAWIPNTLGMAEIEANQRVRSALVFGTGTEFPELFGVGVSAGQFLPPDNPDSPRALAVIGKKLLRDLYGDKQAVGDRIRVSGSRFRIIGVLDYKGDIVGFDLDEMIIIPAARAMELFNKAGLMEIDIKYQESAPVNEIIENIRTLLIARHGVEDFNITTQQQAMDVLSSVLQVLTLGIAALGSISLFVGGVGIFTIMTIAVRERTAEIGLLRALGSTRRQIQNMFLMESIVLASLGGVLGLFLGLGIATGVGLLVSAIPVSVSVPYLVAALLVAAAIGLVAGVVPALRSARLNPVLALRAD